LAAARGLTAAVASPADLLEAERCLSQLEDRLDLPDAEILRRTVRLRLDARAQNPRQLSRDQLDQLTEGLPHVPQTVLFRAECWYQFARRAKEPARGAWQDCWTRPNSCLPRRGVPTSEGATVLLIVRAALLLRSVAGLMLAQEPDTHPLFPVAAAVTNAWLAGLRLATQSIRTPCYRTVQTEIPNLDGDLSILCPEDAALVRIVVAHAARRPANEADFERLSGWGPDEFFAMSLLRARQARLRGFDREAADWYNRLFEEAKDRGPNFLLDVQAEEGMG
jgi:hypothetical protein